jgi:hypothetical protein
MSPSDLSTMGNSVDQGVKLIDSEIVAFDYNYWWISPRSRDQTPTGINFFLKYIYKKNHRVFLSGLDKILLG